jgi:hypothetical protein
MQVLFKEPPGGIPRHAPEDKKHKHQKDEAMIRFTQLASISIALACEGALALSAHPAFARDHAAVDKLLQMNKKALHDFDMREFDAAKKTLNDALVAGKTAGLDSRPVTARTYVNLGAVYIAGYRERQKGIQSFARALEIDPQIQLSKGIETDEIMAEFAEAQRSARAGGTSSGGRDRAAPPPAKRRRRQSDGDEESALPAHITALDCPHPDEAIIDTPLTLRCALAPNLSVANVYLMYELPGKEEYTEILMTKTPKGWRQAKIPKKAIIGMSIRFFFEGRNGAGKLVVANGSAAGPNVVPVVEDLGEGGGPRVEPEVESRSNKENPRDP